MPNDDQIKRMKEEKNIDIGNLKYPFPDLDWSVSDFLECGEKEIENKEEIKKS
jgi:hypothetical protein